MKPVKLSDKVNMDTVTSAWSSWSAVFHSPILCCALRLCEAQSTSTDLSRGLLPLSLGSGIAVRLNSQQFTAGENIEAAVSIRLCMHARAPTH